MNHNLRSSSNLAYNHCQLQPNHSQERSSFINNGSCNIVSGYSSIGYENVHRISPHGNPMLSGQTSVLNSVRQSLAFNNAETVVNYRYAKAENFNGEHILNETLTGSANILAASTSCIQNNERESFAIFNSINIASNQSLPPLSKQLLSRRTNNMPSGDNTRRSNNL